MTYSKTVFDAFPQSSNQAWTIAQVLRGTEVGKTVTNKSLFYPIVSDGMRGMLDTSPSAEGLDADILLYARPEEMPTLLPHKLVAGYIVIDPEGDYYNIVDAGTGLNQHSGEIEHFELSLQMTEAVE